MDSSHSKIQRPSSLYLKGLVEGQSMTGALNCVYITAPCGHRTPNHKFLMTPVTVHANDPTPHRLNQCFCEVIIKGVCWAAEQFAGLVVGRMLLSQSWPEAKGSPLCLSHDPLWPMWDSDWPMVLLMSKTDNEAHVDLSSMHFCDYLSLWQRPDCLCCSLKVRVFDLSLETALCVTLKSVRNLTVL